MNSVMNITLYVFSDLIGNKYTYIFIIKTGSVLNIGVRESRSGFARGL